MRNVSSTESVQIKIGKQDLLEGKYLPVIVLSSLLKKIEEEKGMSYKQLRNRMYNSRNCNKYNLKKIAGLDCINVRKPMIATASLDIQFEVTE